MGSSLFVNQNHSSLRYPQNSPALEAVLDAVDRQGCAIILLGDIVSRQTASLRRAAAVRASRQCELHCIRGNAETYMLTHTWVAAGEAKPAADHLVTWYHQHLTPDGPGLAGSLPDVVCAGRRAGA
jgi:hypothetical protein